jgi:hypothetical protein
MDSAKAVRLPLRFVVLTAGHFSKLTTRPEWRMTDRITPAR